jgi:hypothetical protein
LRYGSPAASPSPGKPARKPASCLHPLHSSTRRI